MGIHWSPLSRGCVSIRDHLTKHPQTQLEHVCTGRKRHARVPDHHLLDAIDAE